VGGERTTPRTAKAVEHGSSPRGRGTREAQRQELEQGRFIPAWAGNAATKMMTTRKTTVHPRVGGERSTTARGRCAQAGSSPRGRGTPPLDPRLDVRGRFIPAWAGNAGQPRAQPPDGPVHPRVGGERETPGRAPSRVSGSSPRGRGTRCR